MAKRQKRTFTDELDEITPKIIEVFKTSRNNYGTRKIKVELKKLGYIVSRRKILGTKWNYVCLLVDLYNREIIGYSAEANKDAHLVYRAFAGITNRLNAITLFHTDRGSELKNKLIDEVLETFEIKRSLSMKGCPYDNALAEATFKIVKTEFIRNYHFDSLEQLEIMLADYVNWFNNFRSIQP